MISAIARVLLGPPVGNPTPLTKSLVIVRQVEPVMLNGEPRQFAFLPFARGRVYLGKKTWITAEERSHIEACDQFRLVVLEER